MSAKILITGGAGFIGSHLADSLLTIGHQVCVIDNYSTGRRDNLTPHSNLTVVEDTIYNVQVVNKIFSDFLPDIVVHAAASYQDPDNWEEDTKTNTLGSAIVIQASRRVGVKRLIYFQTALCYGLKPMEQPITLNHPIMPDGSSYAISKTAGEQYIHLGGIDYISFRLANAYGPRNLSGPLPTFFSRLTTGKPCFVMETRRDFIFIDDLVRCVMLAIDGKGDCGAYHISSGGDYSIKALFDETVKALGITLEQDVEVRPRNPDDAFTILLDPSKTIADFGWQVSTPLERGVPVTIEWYEKYGIQRTFTHLRIAEDSK